jgi:uncharacterized protein (TIGR02453 family)
MNSGFSTFIPDAQRFLGALAQNNTRHWFLSQKAAYEADLKTPALLLLDQIAHDLHKQTGFDFDSKLFRPHRDVRFSKDKTPFHTHLHMMWSERAGLCQDIGYFFGIAPDYVTTGGGIMAFNKDALTKWRTAVDGPFGDKMACATTTAIHNGCAVRDPDLKRVPSPFGADHRHADLLRRKGLSLWREVPQQDRADPAAALHTSFAAFAPVLRILRSAL